MDEGWQAARPRGWPRHGYEKRLGALILACAATIACWYGQASYQLAGLERAYLAHYVAASFRLKDSYPLLHTVDAGGRSRPAIAEEVLAAEPEGLRLSKAARRTGARRLAWVETRIGPAALEAFLREWIYGGRSLGELALPGAWTGLAVLLAGLIVAWPRDKRARKILLEGKRVRGPELVEPRVYNRRRREGSIRFPLLEDREGLLLPVEDEAKHVLLMGDTGTGKSALIR